MAHSGYKLRTSFRSCKKYHLFMTAKHIFPFQAVYSGIYLLGELGERKKKKIPNLNSWERKNYKILGYANFFFKGNSSCELCVSLQA